VGLFSRSRLEDPVRGTAQVISASGYRGRGIWQSCHMTLVIQADGVAPFSAEFDGLVAGKKWPTPGITLPVDVDRANPGRFEIVWDEVEGSRDRSLALADVIAEAMRAKAAGGSREEIAERLQEAIPGAHVVRLGGGGDDDVARLERLAKLHESGALTDEEFAAAKARILAG
jgi:hypothetical protein